LESFCINDVLPAESCCLPDLNDILTLAITALKKDLSKPFTLAILYLNIKFLSEVI